jgi:hypothetical protein
MCGLFPPHPQRVRPHCPPTAALAACPAAGQAGGGGAYIQSPFPPNQGPRPPGPSRACLPQLSRCTVSSGFNGRPTSQHFNACRPAASTRPACRARLPAEAWPRRAPTAPQRPLLRPASTPRRAGGGPAACRAQRLRAPAVPLLKSPQLTPAQAGPWPAGVRPGPAACAPATRPQRCPAQQPPPLGPAQPQQLLQLDRQSPRGGRGGPSCSAGLARFVGMAACGAAQPLPLQRAPPPERAHSPAPVRSRAAASQSHQPPRREAARSAQGTSPIVARACMAWRQPFSP